MSKQPATPAQSVNYPDVLGFISGGRRFTLDVLQLATAARPPAIEAGRSFDALLLLQNLADADVDAVVRLILPAQDLGGKKGTFSTKLVKPLRVGLRPGEVGYVNLPLLVGHQSQPGTGYKLDLEVQVEHKTRNPARVRDAGGGSAFKLEQIEAERHVLFEPVRGAKFTADASGKFGTSRAMLSVPFEVRPPVVAGLPTDLKPNYVSLWTNADYGDVGALAEQARSGLSELLPKLNRLSAFFPLLKKTQLEFTAAGYRLWAGEAVMIAKLLTLMLELGTPITMGGAEPVQPRWYGKLVTELARHPDLARPEKIEHLVIDVLYTDLVFDASMYAFHMLAEATQEDFGTPDEMSEFTTKLVEGLAHRDSTFDFSRAYLPLVLGGILANQRISMAQEKVNETINLLFTAIQKREPERDEFTQTIFDIAEDLIERALMA